MTTHARPLVEMIARQWETRLNLIVTDTYTFDAAVKRPTRLGNYKPMDKEVVIFQGLRRRSPEHDLAGNPPGVAYIQTFHAAIFAIQSDTVSDGIETLVNQREADVVKATCVPETAGQDWAHFNGLALNSEFMEPQDLPMPEFSGVLVSLDVLYRHSERDPYTQR